MKYISETDLVQQHHEQVTELMLRISELEADKTRLSQLLNQLLRVARTYVDAKKNRHKYTYRPWWALCEAVSAMQHIDTEGGG